jgi:hypothetical protein
MDEEAKKKDVELIYSIERVLIEMAGRWREKN